MYAQNFTKNRWVPYLPPYAIVPYYIADSTNNYSSGTNVYACIILSVSVTWDVITALPLLFNLFYYHKMNSITLIASFFESLPPLPVIGRSAQGATKCNRSLSQLRSWDKDITLISPNLVSGGWSRKTLRRELYLIPLSRFTQYPKVAYSGGNFLRWDRSKMLKKIWRITTLMLEQMMIS